MTARYFVTLTLYLLALLASYEIGERWDSIVASIVGYILSTVTFLMSKKIWPALEQDIKGNVKYGGRYVLIVLGVVVICIVVYMFVSFSLLI